MSNAANTRKELAAAEATCRASGNWAFHTVMILMILVRDLELAAGGTPVTVSLAGDTDEHFGWAGFNCSDARTAEWVAKWADRHLAPTAPAGAVILTGNRVRVWDWDCAA